MKTISADYNATTPDGELRLNSPASLADLRETKKGAGDWAWLSDGEILVGGRLRDDPYWGLLAAPDWETLVHLDDEGAQDVQRTWAELQALLTEPERSPEDEARAFELLTQFDYFAPPLARDARPGHLAFRRAMALHLMGKHELALIEIQDARSSRPGKPLDDLFYLELLRRVSPDRAAKEAEALAYKEGSSAVVLAAAITILAERAEDLPIGQFEVAATRAMELCDRFERAPGRSSISASLLSLVHFNRGMLLLRLGRRDEARQSLELAHAIEPLDAIFMEAARLEVHDQRAREIASRVRSRPLAAA